MTAAPSGAGALQRAGRHALPLATLALVLCAASYTRADPDLWGHVQFGTDMLDAGAIRLPDQYSFTSDRPWVNHEWLAEIAMALAWRVGGNAGLVALKLAAIAGALLCLAWIVRREGGDGRATLVLCLLGLAGTLTRVQFVRPQLFSVVCFAILMVVLRRAESKPATLAWAPLLFLIWANSHGGWLVGLGTLALWTACRSLVAPHDLRRHAIGISACAASALATLATPYGVEMWAFLGETVGPSRRYIAEWNPIWGSPATLLPWLGCWALAAAAVVRSRVRPPLHAAAIPAAWGLASFQVSRLDAFFCLSVIAFLTPQLLQLVSRRRAEPTALSFRHSLAHALAGGILAVATVPVLAHNARCIDVHADVLPEADATRLVQSHLASGRMVTFFDWGQYTIWHKAGALRISMDGRRETVYSAAAVDNHLDMYLATGGGLVYLDRMGADYVWLPQRLPLVQRLRSSKAWHPIYDGPQSAIFARGPAAVPVRGRAGPCRCFPGP